MEGLSCGRLLTLKFSLSNNSVGLVSFSVFFVTGLRLFIIVKEFAHFCKSDGVRRKQHISVFLSRCHIWCGSKSIPVFCKHCMSCDMVSGPSCEGSRPSHLS